MPATRCCVYCTTAEKRNANAGADTSACFGRWILRSYILGRVWLNGLGVSGGSGERASEIVERRVEDMLLEDREACI